MRSSGIEALDIIEYWGKWWMVSHWIHHPLFIVKLIPWEDKSLRDAREQFMDTELMASYPRVSFCAKQVGKEASVIAKFQNLYKLSG